LILLGVLIFNWLLIYIIPNKGYHTNAQDMSNTSYENNTSTTCANCGKGEEDGINLKSCNACKMVKYCSRDCQIAHRPQHKKECKKKAKELHEIELFKQPPHLEEDCPICFLRMPVLGSGSVYMNCCGKVICRGCTHAVQSSSGPSLCPFCRIQAPDTDDEITELERCRVRKGDAEAINNLGIYYLRGSYGFPQDSAKSFELFLKAADLGFSRALFNVANSYWFGRGVEVDTKKAKLYHELAAIRGHASSRNELGVFEVEAGNMIRALKHFMIAARGGDINSMKNIKDLYTEGYATKADFEKALRLYQSYLDEIRSTQRDEAAASDDENKYYEPAF